MTTIPNIQTDTLNWYLENGYSRTDYLVLDQIITHRVFHVRETNERKCRYIEWLSDMIENNGDEVREWLSEVHTIDGNTNIMHHMNERLGYID